MRITRAQTGSASALASVLRAHRECSILNALLAHRFITRALQHFTSTVLGTRTLVLDARPPRAILRSEMSSCSYAQQSAVGSRLSSSSSSYGQPRALLPTPTTPMLSPTAQLLSAGPEAFCQQAAAAERALYAVGLQQRQELDVSLSQYPLAGRSSTTKQLSQSPPLLLLLTPELSPQNRQLLRLAARLSLGGRGDGSGSCVGGVRPAARSENKALGGGAGDVPRCLCGAVLHVSDELLALPSSPAPRQRQRQQQSTRQASAAIPIFTTPSSGSSLRRRLSPQGAVRAGAGSGSGVVLAAHAGRVAFGLASGPERSRSGSRPPECNFCRNMGKSRAVFVGHKIHDGNQCVMCPELRRIRCQKCGATGDHVCLTFCSFARPHSLSSPQLLFSAVKARIVNYYYNTFILSLSLLSCV